MRKRIVQFLEWLARLLRVPDGLEIRELAFDETDILVKDEPAAGVDVNLHIDDEGSSWVELMVSKNRYLMISFRSLHHYLRRGK